MYDIVAFGEILIDFTYYGKSESGMDLFEQNPGGAPANVAALCAGFGLRTGFISKVGRDMHGEFLKQTLAAWGVDVRGVKETGDAFTTLAFVKTDGAERSFSFARKPGADTCLEISELNLDMLRHTRVLHYGSLSLTNEPVKSATLHAVRAAKASGALCSYDPNYRASLWTGEGAAIAEMRNAAVFADAIKISEEETRLLTGESDPEKAARILVNGGAQCAVVTLGENGALAYFNDSVIHEPAKKCEAVDTTGAGDTFWGSFLYRIVQSGKPLTEHGVDDIREYLVFANAAASLCVEKRGAMPALPRLEDVYKRVNTRHE